MPKLPDNPDLRDVGRGRTLAKKAAREFDDLAERLFALPDERKRKFPAGDALSRALLMAPEKLARSSLRRHLRRIASLIRDEFTAQQVEAFIGGGAIAGEADAGDDLHALRERLCDSATFDAALGEAVQRFPHLDRGAVSRHDRDFEASGNPRAFAAIFKLLRVAADAIAEDE